MTWAGELYTVVYNMAHTPMDPINVLVTGDVFRRKLMKPPAKGATAAAFDADGRTLVSIVIPDADELSDPTGPDDQSLVLTAVQSFPLLWLYGQTLESNRTALEDLAVALHTALHGAVLTGTGGSAVGLKVIGHSGALDDPVLPATLVRTIRLQADGLWAR